MKISNTKEGKMHSVWHPGKYQIRGLQKTPEKYNQLGEKNQSIKTDTELIKKLKLGNKYIKQL